MRKKIRYRFSQLFLLVVFGITSFLVAREVDPFDKFLRIKSREVGGFEITLRRGFPGELARINIFEAEGFPCCGGIITKDKPFNVSKNTDISLIQLVYENQDGVNDTLVKRY